MPQITTGSTISDTAQIGDGVIVNADVNASAAIAYSKLALADGIVNADINSAAAIVDTKLAQIATASKVSGAAITSLASVPAGAGVLPAANVPDTTSVKNGNFQKDISSTTTTTIAHGLGRIPKRITFWYFMNATATNLAPVIGMGSYNGTTNQYVTSNPAAPQLGDKTVIGAGAVFLSSPSGGLGSNNDGVVSFDGTNITITWTKTGTPTGTGFILWEAN